MKAKSGRKFVLALAGSLFYLTASVAVIGQDRKRTDSLISALKGLPDDTAKVEALRSLFDRYDESDYKMAKEIAHDELVLSKRIKYRFGEANAYRHLGNAFSGLGKSVEAMESQLKALRIYEELKMGFYIAACYNNIGEIYRSRGQYAKAEGNLNRAIEIWQGVTGGDEGIAIAQANLGDIYFEQLRFEQAKTKYEAAMEIASPLGLFETECTTLTSLASIALREKNYILTKTYLDKAYRIAVSSQKKEMLVVVLYYYSEMEYALHHFSKSLKFALRSLAYSKKIATKTFEAKCYQQLALIYAARNDYEKAYRLQSHFIKINDSLTSVNQALQIEKMQYDYQIEKREIVNRALVKEKSLTEAEQYFKRQLGFTITVFLIVVCLFYRRMYVRQRKTNKQLTLQRHEMQSQANEIAAQNEEIISQNEEIVLQFGKIMEQNDSLTKINEALNKVLSVISHDLRAPLRSLEGVVALMRNRMLGPEEINSLSEKLSESVTNAAALLDNLLLWSKSQLKGPQINKVTFDLGEVIQESISILSPQAKQKNITILYIYNVQQKAFADSHMIATVIRNLLSNAVKFTDVKGVITVTASVRGDFASVSIKDNGHGISSEVKDMIFESNSFYSTPGTNNERGTGLGLMICIEYVNLNGGKIWAESTLGEGSTFEFTVRLADVPSDEGTP